jgi:hypothetical protein
MNELPFFYRYYEAEQELNTCLQIYKLCLPPNSFHFLVTKASLGLIYKQQNNYAQALPLFKSISELLGNIDFIREFHSIVFSYRYKNSIIPLD